LWLAYWPFTNEQWVEAVFHVPELFTTAHFGACFQLCRLSTLRPSGPTSLCSGPARKALPHCASLRDRRAFLHVKTALTLAILQTYDCAVLRWPFEELRPKGRAAPKSPQTTKPIDWIGAVGGRFSCSEQFGPNSSKLASVKPDFRQSFRNWGGSTFANFGEVSRRWPRS
jgi:hypothetical protein